MLAHQEHALQVHIHNALPGVFCQPGHAIVTGTNTDIVVEDIQTAEPRLAGADDSDAVGFLTHIRDDGFSLATPFVDHSGGLGNRVPVAVCQHHGSALSRKLQGRCATITQGGTRRLSSACNNGDPA